MHDSRNWKSFPITVPGAIVDNAGFTTSIIDTLGFRDLDIVVQLGALDIALAGFKLTESDASNMAGATDVPGADFSTAGTLPAATDDNLTYGIHVTLLGRKRYMDLTLTGGDGAAGTYATAHAVLSRAETSPNSVSTRGFAQELFA